MLLAVLEASVARLAPVVREVLEETALSDWREGVRAVLETLLAFIEDEPGLSSALLVDAIGAGPNTLAYRARVLKNLSATLREMLAARNQVVPTDPIAQESLAFTTEWVVEGALGMIQARLAQRAALDSGTGLGTFADLVNPLMALTVLPYAGRETAENELGRPVVEAKRRWETPPAPLPDLGMRITHRRLVVLGAIAELESNPAGRGPSSREVAEQVGIKTAGQASKLLARLGELGLIEDTAKGRGSGQAKAWRLMELGETVWRGLGGR